MFSLHHQCHEYSLDFILNNLGPQNLSGASSVLDVGCGPNGRFVHYLLGQGIFAEGLDRTVVEDIHFMNGDCKRIPRADHSYDLVTFHMVQAFFKGRHDFFNKALEIVLAEGKRLRQHNKRELKESALRKMNRDYAAEKIKMIATIDEAVRVLRPEGKIIVWPFPSKLVPDVQSSYEAKGVYLQKEGFTYMGPESPTTKEIIV